MKQLFTWIVRHKKTVLAGFAAVFLVCLVCQNLVAVNYDINDYLPPDSKSTVSIEVMECEFEGGIPNARVMVSGVSIPEALEYKEKISQVQGVTSVTWLDDAVDLTIPLASLDEETVHTYYKEENAVFTVAIEDAYCIEAAAEIREIIGDENAMSGNAVSTAAATMNTVSEVQKIAVIAVIFVLVVLIFTTNAWLEPVLVLGGLGVAIVINSGTNLIFGEISFVTNAAGSILQLAVSLDYSVFLIHRFEELKDSEKDAETAMVEALCKSASSILSSGLTTVIGFLALVLMRFLIGPDLGLALAKGVAISLITVFVFMPALILSTWRLLDRTRHKSLVPDMHWFGRLVRRISLLLVCVFLIVIVPSYLASNSNDYYYGSSYIFGEDTQFGADTAKIEEVFGKSDTYVLMVPAGDTAAETKLSNELNKLPQVTSIISYVDLAGAQIPLEYLDEKTMAQLMSKNYSRMVIAVDVPYEGEETFELVETIRALAESYYPGESYLAGGGVSTYDLMDTVTADMVKVNLVAIAAVFFVLLLTLRSLWLPVILVLSIETAIWINLAIPYFFGTPIFYIAYLIISSIQLGATVDYAILMTDRYKEKRGLLDRKQAVVETVSEVTVSILVSGITLTVVGLLLAYISTNQLLAQLGLFIGRGAVFSLIIVLFVLPGLLYLCDRMIVKARRNRTENERRMMENEEK